MNADLVLDTGALIALQRDRGRMLALIRIAREQGRALWTSAPVLTEFLGHSRPERRLAGEYVVSRLTAAEVNERLARRASTLIQRALDADGRARPSAIDALVAAEAEAREAALVFDGDRRDFEALADASGLIELKDLRELA